MFTASTRYATLTQQVARNLEEDIRRGLLREALPGERRLADDLQVSRRTVRAAIEVLRERGLIEVAQGRTSRILAPRPETTVPARLRNIGLLLPKPLEHLRPFVAVMDVTRTLLHANGFRLETHFGQRYLTRRPEAALQRLVDQFPCDGWILASPTRACQLWFQSAAIPAIIQGTAYEGIPLSCVDLDMEATARHAALTLLRRGHRRLALVIEQADWAGHRNTEQGFLAGTREHADASVQILRHRGSLADLRHLVARLLRAPSRPTALFIVNPYHYLALSSLLASAGVRVPHDLSLLCRDDDICFRYLAITPSRYLWSAQTAAHEVFSALMQAIRHPSRHRAALLLPEHLEGQSLGPPPAHLVSS